ncbi:MAG: VOC family protein [Gemmatimonadales bacterium]|nr:VOC family protein [Gemmatimonadales bacterium]
MSSDPLLGRFAWHELRTTDRAVAEGFYPRLLPWSTAPWEDPSYQLWMSGDAPVGGLMQLTDEMVQAGLPPAWVTFMATPDCDASAAKVTALGGQVYQAPWDIPNIGRIAMVADPQGAEFGLYTPLEVDPGLDAAPVPGQFSWHELNTTDPAAALAFYPALLGWDVMGDFDMGPMGTYHLLGYGGVHRIGITPQPEGVPAPLWLPYAMVPDADAAFATATAHGATTLVPPMEVPGGDRISVMLDPLGVMFAVHALKE